MIRIKKEPGWETDLFDRACHPGEILTGNYFFFAPFFFAAFFFAAMDDFTSDQFCCGLMDMIFRANEYGLAHGAQTGQRNFQLISPGQMMCDANSVSEKPFSIARRTE